jgi:hypothetical protein
VIAFETLRKAFDTESGRITALHDINFSASEGEFVALVGLGVLILQMQFQLNIPGVFSILIVLAVIGISLNFSFAFSGFGRCSGCRVSGPSQPHGKS